MPNKLGNFIKDLLVDKEQKRARSIDDVLWQLYWVIQDERPNAYVNGFYMEDGKMFVIISDSGKLYRASIKFKGQEAYVDDEWYEVVLEFNPTEERGIERLTELARSISRNKSQNSTTILRTKDNKWRWISISCSAVLNRSGAIDSRELMDSFIRHIEEGEAYPHREFYHMGEQYRTGQCDFVARDGYLLITSGIYDDSKLAEYEIAARQADPDYWGDSIEFQPTSEPEMLEVMDGVEIAIYNDGVLRSISTLPENEAAALFTSETLEEVNRMTLTDKAKEAWYKLFGDDEVAADKWLEDNTDPTNRQIDKDKLVVRKKKDDADDDTQNRDDADLDPEADKTDVEPDVEPDEADTDPADADTSDADKDDDTQTEFEIPEELLPVLAESILADERFKSLFQIPALLVPLVEQITGVAEKVDSIEERLLDVERSDKAKQESWSQDVPVKARQIVKINYRAKVDADDADDAEDEELSSDEKAKEVLKKIPEYGPKTELKNMP